MLWCWWEQEASEAKVVKLEGQNKKLEDEKVSVLLMTLPRRVLASCSVTLLCPCLLETGPARGHPRQTPH